MEHSTGALLRLTEIRDSPPRRSPTMHAGSSAGAHRTDEVRARGDDGASTVAPAHLEQPPTRGAHAVGWSRQRTRPVRLRSPDHLLGRTSSQGFTRLPASRPLQRLLQQLLTTGTPARVNRGPAPVRRRLDVLQRPAR